MVYLSIEIDFFSANIIKFFEGGWITVFLAGFVAVCMYAWFNGRMIKQNFIKFVKLKDMFLQLKDIKLDRSIPKYATNLKFLSKRKEDDGRI